MIMWLMKSASAAALAVGMLAGGVVASMAQEYTLRATANSNENDEDYDGLIVFKDYVEKASNGAIAVELFIGHSFAQKAMNVPKALLTGPSISTSPHQVAFQVSSPMCRFSICPIFLPVTASLKKF